MHGGIVIAVRIMGGCYATAYRDTLYISVLLSLWQEVKIKIKKTHESDVSVSTNICPEWKGISMNKCMLQLAVVLRALLAESRPLTVKS